MVGGDARGDAWKGRRERTRKRKREGGGRVGGRGKGGHASEEGERGGDAWEEGERGGGRRTKKRKGRPWAGEEKEADGDHTRGAMRRPACWSHKVLRCDGNILRDTPL